nr:uncharacterized protein LOC105331900 isoform X1 [Crassostrea gigas]
MAEEINKHQENLLKILTVNCQGLGDGNKRKDVFQTLRNKNYHTYFLQDTHFTEKEENMIKSQWGYKAFFSSFKSNSRGVAILFNNNCELEVQKTFKDDSGNFLILDVSVDDLHVLLVNVYGPNLDTPTFYTNLLQHIENLFTNQRIVLGGDFNLIFDKELDSMNYKSLNNPKSRLELLRLIEILNLKDFFRENNPNLKKYTWRRKTPVKQARLDLFLISNTLQNMSPMIKIENSYRSDHSPVVLFIKKNEFLKSKRIWKFNNSLLTEKEYIKIVKQIVIDIKKQYSCFVYDKDNISSVPDDNIQFTISDQLFLDTLLMEIRGKTISYSTYIKKKLLKEKISLKRKF